MPASHPAHHKLHVPPQPKSSVAFKVGLTVVILAVAGTLWYVNKGAESTKAAQALAREDAKPMVTKAGQRGKVTLEDSTIVSMGSSSVVRLTSHFPQDFRALQVNGAAAFNAPTGTTPLLVQVGEGWIVAQDAEFAVRHFSEDSVALIKVSRGTVTVRGAVLERSLAAGAAVQVDKAGAIADAAADVTTEAFSWVDGNFVTMNKPLNEVLLSMKVWYGVDMVARDSSIMKRPITMTASLESSGDAVDSLEKSGSLKHTFEGKGMVITEGPWVPTKKAKKK